MKKAIFLCEKSDKIFRVFDGATRNELRALMGIEEKIYQKADVLENPAAFAAVDTIFSTWGMPAFTEAEIRACFPSLKCVFYGAGTVQKFARPFLACGVKVFSAWAANAVPVAEMTVAQIILANKGYFLTNRLYQKQLRKEAKTAFAGCNGNYGETVGIIGAGMIGRLVIQMLKQYKLKVLVFDPFLPDEKAAELGVEKCELPTLFERAFAVSNHLANNAQTQGMLNHSLFARMRENAVFINTGRGAQVVEEELARVLFERADLTALLDVTEPEPCEPTNPFFSLDNCFMTPHIAGSLGNETVRMARYMACELEAYALGTPTRFEVTAKMLETMA